MTEDPQATRVLVVDDEHSICRALEISFRRPAFWSLKSTSVHGAARDQRTLRFLKGLERISSKTSIRRESRTMGLST